jgi:hypothetical protein
MANLSLDQATPACIRHATRPGTSGHSLRATLYLFAAPETLRRSPTSKKSFSRTPRVPLEWHFSTKFSSTTQSKEACGLEPPYGIEP